MKTFSTLILLFSAIVAAAANHDHDALQQVDDQPVSSYPFLF
jgi:hypothetical protein